MHHLIWILLFLSGSSLVAQDSNLFTVQPEHQLLQRFSGEWQFVKFSPSADGERKELGSGTASVEMLGDFFAISKWVGNVYDTAFQAVQTLGYDVEKSAYSGAWADSVMSYHWQLTGSFDAQKQELFILSKGPGPNGVTAFRECYKFESENQITILGQMEKDGSWTTFMITELSRKK